MDLRRQAATEVSPSCANFAPVDVLLPCPFCGGEPRMREETTAPKDCRHYVGCKSCGAATACQPEAEIAATAWNRREHEPAVAELIEAARPAVTDEGMDQAELDRLRAALASVGGAA